MKKPIVLFVLLFAMVGWSNAQTMITDVYFNGYTEPVWGEHPDFDLEVPANAHYHITEVWWTWDGMGGSMQMANETFDENHFYWMSVSFVPDEGYEIAENCTVYFNGDASICAYHDESVASTIRYHLVNPDNYIDEIRVNGYTAPAWGEHPDFDLEVPAEAMYMIDEVSWLWRTEDDDDELTPNSVFDRDYGFYYMSVSFRPVEGYAFSDDARALFNGHASIFDPENSGTVGVVFYAYTIEYQLSEPLPGLRYGFEDGTLQNWGAIDGDGDGFGWVPVIDEINHSGHNGSDGMVVSESWHEDSALTPDNYLVSPVRALCKKISFWACAQDEDYPAEHFGVAVSTRGNTNIADFTTIQEWTMTAKQGGWYQYTVDLSAYAGQEIWVAIRHFNCTDNFILDVDDIEFIEENDVNELGTTVLDVYPNPAKETLHIEGLETGTTIEIYNSLGAMVKTRNVTVEEEINISELAPGVYMVRCGNQTIRFVKE